MHFDAKSYLKSTRNHTAKQALNQQSNALPSFKNRLFPRYKLQLFFS